MSKQLQQASGDNQDFMFDREVETLSRQAISEIQTERLRWTLNQAYKNVPHYEKAFDKAGVNPSKLRSINDLRHFQFTVKTDLRDNYPSRCLQHHSKKCADCTPLPAQPASQLLSDIRKAILNDGRD